jgi:hypothetical protein
MKADIIVIDNGLKRGKSTVVEKSAFLVSPQSLERCRPVAFVGRSVSLEVIDTNFLARMQVPARLGIERLAVTASALPFSAEKGFTAVCRFLVEAFSWRNWRGQG